MRKIEIPEDVLTTDLDACATVKDWLEILNQQNPDHFVDVTENLDNYTLNIWYHRKETDEEYDKRIQKRKEISSAVYELLKKTRYQEYLKLKEEFEPNDKDI